MTRTRSGLAGCTDNCWEVTRHDVVQPDSVVGFYYEHDPSCANSSIGDGLTFTSVSLDGGQSGTTYGPSISVRSISVGSSTCCPTCGRPWA